MKIHVELFFCAGKHFVNNFIHSQILFITVTFLIITIPGMYLKLNYDSNIIL